MARCVIIGGAEIARYDRVNEALRPDDFCVFCDSGLRHLSRLQVTPGLIVGDFDSHPQPETEVETIVLPREKADTDTVEESTGLFAWHKTAGSELMFILE